MKATLTALFLCFVFLSSAQTPTQTVRGSVFDSETQFPLIGVKLQIFTADSTVKNLRALSDPEGSFSIRNVPVGKHQLVATYMTYDTRSITVEVTSGKEAIVQVPMQETFVDKEEVVVTGRKKGEVINELALLSAQQFSVAETDRYAGSRSDPARMASNFAGVGGADDSRNDIVIRGNSPLGVVWKVEGIDIPNPNHFAITGSTGGPVSILNNKILANSDFLMSAFPAEYGNSTSGVFDLKLRHGNTNQHELTGQFGFLGTEIMAEGPMGDRASYLMMGRYSTLSLFQVLGIQIGTDAVPTYGDGAFKFNWRLKNGGAISCWGMGGASKIDILISEQYPLTLNAGGSSQELYGEGDRDQRFRTHMYVSGLTYKKPINEKTFLQTTVAFSREHQRSNHNYLVRRDSVYANGDSIIDLYNPLGDSIYPLVAYSYFIDRASAYLSINHKFNKRHLIKYGVNADVMMFNMVDSVLNPLHTGWVNRWDYQGSAALLQGFAQWKWRMNEDMQFTAGIHSQYFSQSNSISIAEPRVGWKWRLSNSSALSAGAGMHSMTQPMYTYFYDPDGDGNLMNGNMDFSRSIHSGIGYEKSFGNNLNFKTEAYYQYLYNIPVTADDTTAFSLINMGSGFARFFPTELKNTGTGTNYGIEFTLQKFFDNSFYFLFTGTLFDSKYVASDGIERNTSYNGNYIANLLAGKEFKIGDKHMISIGFKGTYAGGKLYGPVDQIQSAYLQELVYLNSGFNSLRFRDYFRIDTKINWRMNADKVTHEIGLDLVNITNQRNLLSLSYAPDLFNPSAEPTAERLQLGFLPIFYYRADFRIAKGKNKEN